MKESDSAYLRRKSDRAAAPSPARANMPGSGICVSTILSIIKVSVLPGPPHSQELIWKLNCHVAPVGMAPEIVPRFTLKVCQVLAALSASLRVAFIFCEPPK